MSNYKIITDSSCDFTIQQYKDLDLAYAPLSLYYKGATHSSFTEVDQLRDLYDGLRNGEMPTTSAVNPEGWIRIMEPILTAGKDILCLAFTSGLSATYQSAVIAANEMKEKYPQRTINVVDTLCAALGQGLLVWYACQKQKEGMGLEELTVWCESHKLNLCHEVTVNDLNHLKRGGRVSAATAFVGGMLGIKPIICMDNEGKLSSIAKCRGRRAAIEYLVNKMVELGDSDYDTITIAHGDCPEDAAILEKLVRERCPYVKHVTTGYVGGVIGAHTGPGVLVVFFMGKHR